SGPPSRPTRRPPARRSTRRSNGSLLSKARYRTGPTKPPWKPGCYACANDTSIAERGELMPTLTITRGLPGSGKTTWAKQQGGHVRVNRDELRRMLHGGALHTGWAEVQVTLAQRAQVEALLRAGLNVICDDTNLRARVVRELAELGRQAGASVVVRDFTQVPVEVCIARDALRPEPERVGGDVIRAMW